MAKDLKDKYSDPELNPSNKDYEESVNPSNNESDDDSVVAHDLRRSEEGLGPIQKRLQRRDNEQQKLRDAEAAEWNDPQNRFGYKPENKDDAKVGGSTRRKNAAKLGAAGGVLVLVLAAFGMLLPLKIPGIMQMISDEAGQRVEEVTERRAKLIVARAIAQKFATTGSGIVVTGSGPVSSLIASMRTNNFEKKLADKGLTIEKTADGVKLKSRGSYLSIVDKNVTKVVMGNEYEVLQALDGSQHGRALLREIVKEEIPSWRWMKRAKFAKWLRIKYGIPRYGIANSTDADNEKAIAEMETDRLTAEVTANSESNKILLSCITSPDSGCDLVSDGSTGDSSTKSGNGTDVSGSLDEVNNAAIEQAAQGSTEDASKFITSEMTKKFAAKAIPIIGWIDLAATISHLVKVEAEDDYLGKAVAGLKERNYAQLNGFWSGYASQTQLGALRTDYSAKLAKQTEGIEKAQAFSYIQGNTISGNPITLFNDTAYATTASDIPGVPVDRIDSNNPGYVKEKLTSFNNQTSGVAGAAGKPTGALLELWYQTLGEGGLLGEVGDIIGDIANSLTPGVVKDWAARLMEKGWAQLLEIFGLDYNPFVSGAKWFNNAHGGATASFNTYGKEELVLRKLSPAQASLQNMRIAASRAETVKENGVFYALFSTEVNSSITNQLAVSAPTDFSQFGSSVASFVMNSPQRLFSGFMPNVNAANPYVDLYGVDPYGATEDDLNQPLAEEAITGDACPEVAEGEYNNCVVDNEVAEGMLCEYYEESEECGDTDATDTALTGDASEFTVASYNILHSVSHTDDSIRVGGCGRNPVPGDPRCTKTRGDRQVKIITGQLGNPVFDIFGTQETAPEQYDYLKKNLPGYAAFPETTERMNNMDDGAVAIFWNTAKFQMIENGKARGKSNTSKYISNPWVGLQTSSGQKVYVMSIHYAVAGYGGTPESIRESSSLTMDWVKSKAADDNIVIVVGDFNDRLAEQHYCIYTKNSAMQHAVDMSAGADLNQGCSKRRFGGIDHIYATPSLGLTAKNWTAMADTGEVARASDHVPVYTTYAIPGADAAVTPGQGGWSWPLGEQLWKDFRADFLGSHYAGGGFLGNGNSSNDISFGNDTGKPVYSILDGVVKQQPLGRSSYRCAGSPNGDNNGGMLIESKVNGKIVQIAYAHGSDPTLAVGSPVRSGQEILKLGNVGNSCGSHLHLDMTYGDRNICTQDVFLVMGENQTPDLDKLAAKATSTCAGRL